MVGYGGRYGRILPEALGFRPPDDGAELVVVERLAGNATTDFGAPALPPAYDERPLDEDGRLRYKTILAACWRAFDGAVEAAAGKTLRKGPRGGGRELEGIIEHVLGGDSGYLSCLGWRFKLDETAELSVQLAQCREAILAGLAPAVRGEIAPEEPRGGKRWSPRYYVRRSAWHVLDHVWEIEDRVEAGED
jgi:hypothetical protein